MHVDWSHTARHLAYPKIRWTVVQYLIENKQRHLLVPGIIGFTSTNCLELPRRMVPSYRGTGKFSNSQKRIRLLWNTWIPWSAAFCYRCVWPWFFCVEVFIGPRSIVIRKCACEVGFVTMCGAACHSVLGVATKKPIYTKLLTCSFKNAHCDREYHRERIFTGGFVGSR